MRITHMNKSCETYECVMSHVWMSHVRIWMRRVTYQGEMSHVWMSRVPHVNEFCSTEECVISRIWTRHVPNSHTFIWGFICVIYSHKFERASERPRERSLIWASLIWGNNAFLIARSYERSFALSLARSLKLECVISSYETERKIAHMSEHMCGIIHMGHIWSLIWAIFRSVSYEEITHSFRICVAWFILICVASFIWEIKHSSYVWHMNEACPIYEWDVSHI